MKIRFLTENKTSCEGILAEHGLSIYIESKGRKILFDSGASDVFAFNAERMGVDLSEVDLAVVSHGHYDHTGGFPLFCRVNDHAPIYIHKNAFRQSHGVSDGKIEEEMCGIRWTPEQKKALESRMHLTDGPVFITEDIVITGTIPTAEGFEPSEKFYYKNLDGNPVEDDMSHEQALAIREDDGIYLFSGCSHRGIVSAIEAAKAIFPEDKIAMVIAGMHLYEADHKTRADVTNSILAAEVEKVMPVHCTGMDAICELKSMMRDRCVIAQAGDCFEFGADETDEK